MIVGQEDGVLIHTDSTGFLDYCRKLHLPRRRIAESYRVIWTDVQGSVASARIEEYYQSPACVSFLTVTRLNGAWKVICRGFYSGLACGLTGLSPLLSWLARAADLGLPSV